MQLVREINYLCSKVLYSEKVPLLGGPTVAPNLEKGSRSDCSNHVTSLVTMASKVPSSVVLRRLNNTLVG